MNRSGWPCAPGDDPRGSPAAPGDGSTDASTSSVVALAAALLALAASCATAGTTTLPDRLLLSVDVTLSVGAGTASAADVLHADGTGALMAAQASPQAIRDTRGDLVALAERLVEPNAERWMVLDVPFAPAASPLVPAGRPFRCVDEACDHAELLPLPQIDAGVGVAALAFDTDGATVLLALDAGGEVGGTAFPGGVVLACDAVACAVEAGPGQFPDGPRVDSLAALDDGRWLVGFDSGGEVAGLAFRDEDLLLFDPVAGSWGAALAPAAVDAQWHAANLDAVAVPVALPDALFMDGFEAD